MCKGGDVSVDRTANCSGSHTEQSAVLAHCMDYRVMSGAERGCQASRMGLDSLRRRGIRPTGLGIVLQHGIPNGLDSKL
jgi:hypothetical protein